MLSRFTNKSIQEKSNSELINEETKNSISNSKNIEHDFSNKSIFNKKKKALFQKKQKNISIGINLEKLIINNNKRKNNSPQLDIINRNLSYNNSILTKKTNKQNNTQSTLSKSNTKQDYLKNLKHSSTNFTNNNNTKNNNYIINKGKTYFVGNIDLTEETIKHSTNAGRKIINKFNANNSNIHLNYDNQKPLINNSKIILKNNSFTNQKQNNMIVPSTHKIKNCYTNININKNDLNRTKIKPKTIPFSLKKLKPKIDTVIENNNNNNEINIENYEENIRPIYKNENLLIKKKNKINKVLSIKIGYNKDIFLTEKNNNNNNLKKSFLNSEIKNSFYNEINNKRMSPILKNGNQISSFKKGLELSDNKSYKIVRKLDYDEEPKKDTETNVSGENNFKKGKIIISKVSKIKILHDNQKKNYMIENNKLNNKNKIKNININNSKSNTNIKNGKIWQRNNGTNFQKIQKSPKLKSMNNSSLIKINTESNQKLKNENKNKLTENNRNTINNNDIINNNTESEKDNEENEEIDTIEDSLKKSNHIISIHIFKASKINSLKTNINLCVNIIPNLLKESNIIEMVIHFCDLNSLNKLCLISKKYYIHIKPFIYKIIRENVFNYNKKSINNYKNKIKISLFKFSSLSEMSKALLEKKYKDLLFENNCIYDEQIKKDLTRTLPNNLSFQYGNSNYNKLYHLLTAYSNYNKNIGYAQGLNFLAANSILIFDKEIDEFLFLDSLIQKFNLENIIGLSNNLSIKLEKISNCLNKYIPNIKIYLENMNLNYEFFLAGWVLTLFSNSINNKYLLYLWDYMIIFGWDYFNCFVIAVLKKYEDEILKLPLYKLTFYMKNILKNQKFEEDFENIIKSSFTILLKEKNFKIN